ncbi:TIGR02444 family protein [Methylobacterium sp. A54F]
MPDNAFWGFSLELYGRPGVAAACLALQDEAGADVNLVLYLLWCAVTGRVLDEAAIATADARIAPWRAGVVESLRAVRRALKADPLREFGSEAFRGRVKAVELEAERLVQDALFRDAPAPGSPEGRSTVARDHLRLYARHLGRHFPEAELAVLLGALAKA